MKHPISTKVHGVIDYTWVVALPLLSLFVSSTGVARLLRIAGIGTLCYSLLTQYELGLVKRLPMKIHLGFDKVQAVVLLLVAVASGASAKARLLAAGLGLLSLIVALNTQPAPSARQHLMARLLHRVFPHP